MPKSLNTCKFYVFNYFPFVVLLPKCQTNCVVFLLSYYTCTCAVFYVFIKKASQGKLYVSLTCEQRRQNDFGSGWASPGKSRWSVVISKTKTKESNAKSGWARPTQLKKWVDHWPTWFCRHCLWMNMIGIIQENVLGINNHCNHWQSYPF